MRKKIWLLVCTLFLLLMVYLAFCKRDSDHKRKQDFSVAKGSVLTVNSEVMNGSHVAEITYKMQVGGKDFTHTARVTCEKSNFLFVLINKKMDVVYENDDPANCELLLSRKSYQEYNLLPSADILHVLESLEITCGAIE